MEHYSFWSVVPPIVAIILAIWTRQVFVSLFVGIFLGFIIIHQGNILQGTLDSIEKIVDTFKDAGNTRTVIFTLLIGVLIAYIQRSGGVNGFILFINKKLDTIKSKDEHKKSLYVRLFAVLVGMLIFVESNISILTVGTLFRPLFDKLKISREKLAYICDSTSAPSCILIPFNAWGAFIMSLLIAQGLTNPFEILYTSIIYNFYPIITLCMLVIVVITNKDILSMKKAERRVKIEGKIIADGSTPLVSEEITIITPQEKKTHKAYNMIVPLFVMVISMPLFLFYTGMKNAPANAVSSLSIFDIISYGSGSASVLYAVIVAIGISVILSLFQKIMSFQEMIDLSFKGMGGMISMALLMVLAFTIGNVCKELGTGIYVAEITKSWISPAFLPAIIFGVGSVIAFATGTSWGTFAIMIPIAVPLANSLGINIHIVVAAVLGGGVFGDHCSPISDTTLISSMASACDHIDHVKTQMPYALISALIAFIFYVFVGIAM
ncbi:MAG: Na+/H+ antiporter NhaC family protein [Chitinophagaceae bacterium]|nr:Na+/H+ antiporter NhaC family protein [Chitinophagaceae bacterium]